MDRVLSLLVLATVFLVGPVVGVGAACSDYGLTDCTEKGVVEDTVSIDVGETIAYFRGNLSGAPVSRAGWESVALDARYMLQPQEVWSISFGGQDILFTGEASLDVSRLEPGTYVLFVWGCSNKGDLPTDCRWLKPWVFTVADDIPVQSCQDAGGFCTTGTECRTFGGSQLANASCDYSAASYCCTLEQESSSTVQSCQDAGGFCTTGTECRQFGGEGIEGSCDAVAGVSYCCDTGSGEVDKSMSCRDAGGTCVQPGSCSSADRISRVSCPTIEGVTPTCCDTDIDVSQETVPLLLSVRHELHEGWGIDEVCAPVVGCYTVDQDEITIQLTAENPRSRTAKVRLQLRDEDGNLVLRQPVTEWEYLSPEEVLTATYTTKWKSSGLGRFDEGYRAELVTETEGIAAVVEEPDRNIGDDAADARTVCDSNSDCSDFEVCSDVVNRCVQPVSCRSLQLNGPTSEKIDVVFIGDNYYFMDNFRTAVHKLVTPQTDNDVRGLFSVEPFASNRDLFNIWYMKAENKIPYTGDLPDAVHSSLYGDDMQRPEVLSSSVISATHCPWGDVSVVISRNEKYRPYAFVENAMAFVSVGEGVDGDCTGYNWGKCDGRTMLHEFGHAFGKLADEYTERGVGSEPRYPNCAADREQAREWWGDLMSQHPDLGFFEGCSYVDNNVRPTENSIMRQQWRLEDGWGPVNLRRLQQQLDRYRRDNE